VWDTKNQNIELMAEGQHMHSTLAAAQAAAATGEQQVRVRVAGLAGPWLCRPCVRARC